MRCDDLDLIRRLESELKTARALLYDLLAQRITGRCGHCRERDHARGLEGSGDGGNNKKARIK